MSTTGVNIVQVTNAVLEGATVGAALALSTMNPADAKQLELAGYVTRLDTLETDLSKQSFAKNGGAYFTLSGTTAVTLSLLDLTSTTTFSTGDTVYATVNQLTIKNLGLADITIAPGGSNPSNFPKFSGTTPTLTIPAGSALVLTSLAGVTVDSTHKTILITPTSGGAVSIAVGGA